MMQNTVYEYSPLQLLTLATSLLMHYVVPRMSKKPQLNEKKIDLELYRVKCWQPKWAAVDQKQI